MRRTAQLGWNDTDADFQHLLYRGRRFCAPTITATASVNARGPRRPSCTTANVNVNVTGPPRPGNSGANDDASVSAC